MSDGNNAIIELRSLKTSQNPEPGEILLLHAKASAIFKIGPAAVCAKMRRMSQFASMSIFADEMAKIGQALDDLTDIEQDFGQGELNYASAFILQRLEREIPARKHALTRIRSVFLGSDVIPQFFQELRTHFLKARRALQPMEIGAASEYFQRYEAELIAIEEYLYRRQIKLIFHGFTRSSP